MPETFSLGSFYQPSKNQNAICIPKFFWLKKIFNFKYSLDCKIIKKILILVYFLLKKLV